MTIGDAAVTNRCHQSVRRSLLASPGDAACCAEHMRGLGDAVEVFRWYQRLVVLAGADVDGDVLRRALIASNSIDIEQLRRFANSRSARDRTIPTFVAAALLVTGRLDARTLSGVPAHYRPAGDGLASAVSIVSNKTVPASPRDAFDIAIAKQRVGGALQAAGFPDLAGQFAVNVATFSRRIRRNLYGTTIRGFTDHWTRAIGHAVLLAFLIKGQASGIFDFDGVRIWEGTGCNRFLIERLLELSPNVAVVRRWSVFADNYSSRNLEWIDGRFLDCFEACGVVADQAGDERGAILERPAPGDPALARFFDAAGLQPDIRIVTLHCREPGYRPNERHDLRNADIARYVPALRALVARGYHVVRLGDPTMTPLPAIQGVVDYAVSALKSPDLDVLLPAVAQFHIGCSSGLSLVPLLYGTPCLFLNWYPFDLLPWGRRNWTVLKPIESLATRARVVDRGRYATLGQMREAPLLRAFGHEARDLKPEEVERAVIAFAATLEAGEAEPAKEGRNIGRILVADDAGEFRDLQ